MDEFIFNEYFFDLWYNWDIILDKVLGKQVAKKTNDGFFKIICGFEFSNFDYYSNWVFLYKG